MAKVEKILKFYVICIPQRQNRTVIIITAAIFANLQFIETSTTD